MHTITSNLDILHLILSSDIVSIKDLSLILETIHQCVIILSSDIVSIKDLSLILETIHQCVIKHIIFLPIKTIVNFEGFDLLNH
jgi:GTP:adenosylcobinamide-phosphate guanylyltransferase